jgi:hypothetical protein
MAADAVIRVPVATLASTLSRDGEAVAMDDLLAAARANRHVFALTEEEGHQFIATTPTGRAPVPRDPMTEHGLKERFLTPAPKPVTEPARERHVLEPSWAAELQPRLGVDEALFGEHPPAAIIVERHVLPPVLPEEEPVESAEEEAAGEEYDVIMPVADEPIVAEIPSFEEEVESSLVEAEPGYETAPAPEYDDLAAAMVGEPLSTDFDEEPILVEEPEVAEVEAPVSEPSLRQVEVPKLVPEPEVLTPAPQAAVRVTDISGYDDATVAEVIAERLGADVRVANFGDQWMLEDRVPRFSRGDLRRMREYIQEQEQPLTDDVLGLDVLGVRQNSPDFDLTRFAVNYRLSREHRDFEFVGTNDQRFWSTSGLPQIGTTRRKPNELGTDYRFLLDELPENPQYHSADSLLHVVTFFEYYHGLLPYDAEMQALLPAPLLPDQRSAMLTFETPQSYTTFLVELRYPTPNRGGFILGLDDFFTENLVPGALISIQRTDNDGHYRVEYLPTAPREARLLELEERRSPRYVFRLTTYACDADEAMLLTEERFPRLANERPLEDRIRRRPEAVVAETFERIGERSDGVGFVATFQDLYAAVNIERPFSETLLRRVLETDETGAFAKDPDREDAYTYVPSNPS